MVPWVKNTEKKVWILFPAGRIPAGSTEAVCFIDFAASLRPDAALHTSCFWETQPSWRAAGSTVGPEPWHRLSWPGHPTQVRLVTCAPAGRQRRGSGDTELSLRWVQLWLCTSQQQLAPSAWFGDLSREKEPSWRRGLHCSASQGLPRASLVSSLSPLGCTWASGPVKGQLRRAAASPLSLCGDS